MTLATILVSLQTVTDLHNSLANSKSTLDNVLYITSLPIERARGLATAINNTILPEAFVEEILRNASDSHMIAQSAFNTAQNALYVYSY